MRLADIAIAAVCCTLASSGTQQVAGAAYAPLWTCGPTPAYEAPVVYVWTGDGEALCKTEPIRQRSGKDRAQPFSPGRQGDSPFRYVNSDNIRERGGLIGGRGQDCNANGIPDEDELGEPVEEAELAAVDAVSQEQFGHAVSMSGDIAVVSALPAEAAGLDSGAGYVFRYNGLGWDLEAEFTPADAVPQGMFGASVSTSPKTSVNR